MKISLPSLIVGNKKFLHFIIDKITVSQLFYSKNMIFILPAGRVSIFLNSNRKAERILQSYFLQTRVGSEKDYKRRVNSKKKFDQNSLPWELVFITAVCSRKMKGMVFNINLFLFCLFLCNCQQLFMINVHIFCNLDIPIILDLPENAQQKTFSNE